MSALQEILEDTGHLPVAVAAQTGAVQHDMHLIGFGFMLEMGYGSHESVRVHGSRPYRQLTFFEKQLLLI